MINHPVSWREVLLESKFIYVKVKAKETLQTLKLNIPLSINIVK